MGKKLLLQALLSLFAALVFVSCSKDEDKGVEQGNLAGSKWSRESTSNSSVMQSESTYTYSFTGKDAGVFTQRGRYRSNTSLYGIKWGEWQSSDRTVDFTFIYTHVEQVGVVTQSGSQYPFTISDDFETLTLNGATYTRE